MTDSQSPEQPTPEQVEAERIRREATEVAKAIQVLKRVPTWPRAERRALARANRQAPSRRPRWYYVSGPMRGYPRFNFDKFYECEHWLRTHGLKVHNPARVDMEKFAFDPTVSTDEQGFDVEEAMARDIAFIASDECEAVVVLPGWELSIGAKWEVGVAQLLGKRVYEWVADTDWPSGYSTRPLAKRVVAVATARPGVGS